LLARLALDDGTTLTVPGTPILIEDVAPPVYRRGPRLGEHSRAVLTSLSGLDQSEIAAYAREGIVAV
jgi:crotonobetainyl-CoA:carnitine CoA-transferase CaiB-like acyl-CoA transferase